MLLRQIFIISLMLFSISGLCLGQEFVEDENWLRKVAGPYCGGYRYLNYRYETFSKDDVTKAKEKLKLIKQFAPKNEWESIYVNRGTAVGDYILVWNSEGGFLSFYCYHDLRYLDYGAIKDSPDFVELVSEKPIISTANKKQLGKIEEKKLIKVKFGETHYLVPENLLQDFTVSAAGLNTNFDYSAYWEKVEDIEKKTFGLPIMPEKYKHLIRLPIETEITSVGERKIIPNAQSTAEYNFDDIHYPVTLSAGKNKELKVGMNFYVEDLGEWIEITKVNQKTSDGVIRRDFGENKKEQCRDGEGGSGQIISCREIKAGMKARTKGNI